MQEPFRNLNWTPSETVCTNQVQTNQNTACKIDASPERRNPLFRSGLHPWQQIDHQIHHKMSGRTCSWNKKHIIVQKPGYFYGIVTSNSIVQYLSSSDIFSSNSSNFLVSTSAPNGESKCRISPSRVLGKCSWIEEWSLIHVGVQTNHMRLNNK